MLVIDLVLRRSNTMKYTLKLSAASLVFLGASVAYANDHTVHVIENQ